MKSRVKVNKDLSFPGWRVDRHSYEGFYVWGDAVNADHSQVTVNDLINNMIARYNSRERAICPSWAPLSRRATKALVSLFLEMILDALADGRRVILEDIGSFIPAYLPEHTVISTEKSKDKVFTTKKGKIRPVTVEMHDIYAHWGTIGFVPDKLATGFGVVLGEFYRNNVPEESLNTLRKDVLDRQRKESRKAISERLKKNPHARYIAASNPHIDYGKLLELNRGKDKQKETIQQRHE